MNEPVVRVTIETNIPGEEHDDVVLEGRTALVAIRDRGEVTTFIGGLAGITGIASMAEASEDALKGLLKTMCSGSDTAIDTMVAAVKEGGDQND